MEIHFVIADPAGNITAIVKDGVADDDYRSVAAAIMQDPQWKVEQVGFITEPKVGGEARLQMMGGEFCGNAARSFGKYIAKKMRRQEAVIEISGNSVPMRIETDPARGSAKAQMPCPLKIDELSVGLGSYPVVVFEGIAHLITEKKMPEPDDLKKLLSLVYQKYDAEAAGVMYLEKTAEGYRMTPAVHVRATDSLVYENSCGSGSVAAASYLAQQQCEQTAAEQETCTYDIQQPGGCITASVTFSHGKVTAAFIDGTVSIGGEIAMEIGS